MSSPSDDTDDLMIDPLAEELRNIESVIIVTSRNIDALNEKFANLQNPPLMYVVEYQELTSRLHELEEKKHEITEKLQQNESPEPPEETIEVFLFLSYLFFLFKFIILFVRFKQFYFWNFQMCHSYIICCNIQFDFHT